MLVVARGGGADARVLFVCARRLIVVSTTFAQVFRSADWVDAVSLHGDDERRATARGPFGDLSESDDKLRSWLSHAHILHEVADRRLAMLDSKDDEDGADDDGGDNYDGGDARGPDGSGGEAAGGSHCGRPGCTAKFEHSHIDSDFFADEGNRDAFFKGV